MSLLTLLHLSWECKKYFKWAGSDSYLSNKKGHADMYLYWGGKVKGDLPSALFSTLLLVLWCGSTLSCPASPLDCCVNAWWMCVFRCEEGKKKNSTYEVKMKQRL